MKKTKTDEICPMDKFFDTISDMIDIANSHRSLSSRFEKLELKTRDLQKIIKSHDKNKIYSKAKSK